ncbi:uncharacterized protein LOC117341246 [Pecten maximus]|uniref:uncharacterized protein LOC117341246 n=1 Tax=Pecten maximus TaxID=6579 RepID=UPI001458EFD5|nr:uncharacterized protein LOC117341246 [Pecten maximus]
MNRPVKVSCEANRSRDQVSSESFMELQILTKDGDLDWKLENSQLHESRQWITFYVNNIRKGVQKSIALMLSNYRISFSEPENRHLEREIDILIAIYRGRINTKPWRQIGVALGVPLHDLNALDARKPRSLQEKVCMVLGKWLKDNPRRSLREISSVWN